MVHPFTANKNRILNSIRIFTVSYMLTVLTVICSENEETDIVSWFECTDSHHHICMDGYLRDKDMNQTDRYTVIKFSSGTNLENLVNCIPGVNNHTIIIPLNDHHVRLVFI